MWRAISRPPWRGPGSCWPVDAQAAWVGPRFAQPRRSLAQAGRSRPAPPGLPSRGSEDHEPTDTAFRCAAMCGVPPGHLGGAQLHAALSRKGPAGILHANLRPGVSRSAARLSRSGRTGGERLGALAETLGELTCKPGRGSKNAKRRHRTGRGAEVRAVFCASRQLGQGGGIQGADGLDKPAGDVGEAAAGFDAVGEGDAVTGVAADEEAR